MDTEKAKKAKNGTLYRLEKGHKKNFLLTYSFCRYQCDQVTRLLVQCLAIFNNWLKRTKFAKVGLSGLACIGDINTSILVNECINELLFTMLKRRK